MKELKLEMKLVKILEILHKQKVKLLANKKISYSSLHDEKYLILVCMMCIKE
jgi:hypothetical protein